MHSRYDAARRLYEEALLHGTTDDVLAADAEMDAASKEMDNVAE
jgi:hypothetical protein